MRLIRFLLAFVLALGWVLLLNHPVGSIPALGRLLNPVNGYFANAEAASEKGQSFLCPGKSCSNL